MTKKLTIDELWDIFQAIRPPRLYRESHNAYAEAVHDVENYMETESKTEVGYREAARAIRRNSSADWYSEQKYAVTEAIRQYLIEGITIKQLKENMNGTNDNI